MLEAVIRPYAGLLELCGRFNFYGWIVLDQLRGLGFVFTSIPFYFLLVGQVIGNTKRDFGDRGKIIQT